MLSPVDPKPDTQGTLASILLNTLADHNCPRAFKTGLNHPLFSLAFFKTSFLQTFPVTGQREVISESTCYDNALRNTHTTKNTMTKRFFPDV